MLKEIINRYKIRLVLFGDILIFYFSLLITLILRYNGKDIWPKFHAHLFSFTLLLLIWIIVFYIMDFYSYTKLNSTIENKRKLVISIAINFFLSLGVFYIFENFFYLTPRTNLIIFTIIFIIFDYLWRHFFSWFLKQKYNNQKILLLSQSVLNKNLINHIKNNPQLGYTIEQCDKENILKNEFKDNQYSSIVVDNESFSDLNVLKKLYTLVSNNIEIIPFSKFYEKILQRIPIDEIKERWFINEIKFQSHSYDNTKNMIDKLLAIIIIVVLSPLFLFLIILIKITSKGKIFYRQTRIGKNSQPFILFKFRTMYSTLGKNPDARGTNPIWCKKNDNRITKIGKFLRKTHLDELPQLFNIVKGDISFVGPRPERPEFVEILEKEIPHYLFRQMIKPGLTGWGQIKFRYSNTVIESKEKFEYDLYYIKNKNIFLDLCIILKTIQFVFTH